MNTNEIIERTIWGFLHGNQPDAKLAAQAVSQALSDAGLVVVPREPTTSMLGAAFHSDIETNDNLPAAWQAMIGAYEDGASPEFMETFDKAADIVIARRKEETGHG